VNYKQRARAARPAAAMRKPQKAAGKKKKAQKVRQSLVHALQCMFSVMEKL
jgi:hypothetical protein